MGEGIKLGLSLMAVGMFTVFTILFMVVAGGRILIIWVNKFAPEDAKSIIIKHNDDKKIAAVIAVVNVITGGKGRIDSIKKIK